MLVGGCGDGSVGVQGVPSLIYSLLNQQMWWTFFLGHPVCENSCYGGINDFGLFGDCSERQTNKQCNDDYRVAFETEKGLCFSVLMLLLRLFLWFC